MIPVGVRLENPDAWPVAFSAGGEIYFRGSDDYYRWWSPKLASVALATFQRNGWADLAEPLKAAIAEAASYQTEDEAA